MAPITFSGFNNIDFASVIDAIMQQESVPLTQLQNSQTSISTQQSAYTTFATKLSTLQSAIDALKSASTFQGRAATVSDPSYLSVSAGSSTPIGSYEVYVTSLARAQVTTTSSTHADKDTTIVASGGTLQIGEATVTLTGDVTLQGLADAINATPDIGVAASIVKNGSNYQLALTGRETGADHAFTITNSLTGGTGVAFAATNAQDASDAAGTVNGVAFTSGTNAINDVVPGASLTVQKVTGSTTPVQVTVGADNTQLESKITTFVTAYNDAMTFLDQQQSTVGTDGSIGGDSLVRSLRRQLSSVISQTFGSGDVSALAQVGFSLSRTGQLEFDQGAFDAAMSTSAQAVQDLFTGIGGTGGAFSALHDALDIYISSDGLIPSAQRQLTDQASRIAQRIDDMQARLDTRRAQLQLEYAAADNTIAQLNQWSSQLSSLNS